MEKYFNRSERYLLIELLSSVDIDNKLLGLNLIKTHPKYKNFKKLYVFRGRNLQPLFMSGINITVETKVNRCFKWLKEYYNPINNFLVNYAFEDLIKFIKRRTR